MYVKVETSAWHMSLQGGSCCYHQWLYQFSALLEHLLEHSTHGTEQILLIEQMTSPDFPSPRIVAVNPPAFKAWVQAALLSFSLSASPSFLGPQLEVHSASWVALTVLSMSGRGRLLRSPQVKL